MTSHLVTRVTLVVVTLTCVTLGEVVIRDSCSARPSAVLQENGHVFLGGLMDFSTMGGDTYGCGEPAKEGMQEYEAVRWALSRINQDRGTINGQSITDSYIPGVRLGMLVQDSCQRPALALDALTDFIPETGSSDNLCVSNTTQAFVGVVSQVSTDTTGTVSEVLGAYKVPSMSYRATASSLSNRDKYPYFMRTVPSDDVRTQVMLSTLSQLGWNNVAVVYPGSADSDSSFQALTQGAANAGVCISQAIRLPQGTSLTASVYRDTIRRLVSGPAAAVVYLGDAQTAGGLMDAAINVANSGRLQWLMPDSVGTDPSFAGTRTYARGILTVAPASRTIAEFEDHWVRLSDTSTPNNNPWYRNWYMTVNRCRLAGVNYPPYNTYNQCRSSSESQRRASYVQSPYVEPAILSIYAYAKAIKNARSDLCRGTSRGLCDAFRRMTSEDFYKNYLMPLDFTFGRDERIPSLASALVEPYRAAKRVRFNSAGEIMDPTYAVYNFNDRTGVYQFNKVGDFTGGSLSLNKNQLRMYDEARRRSLTNIPESRCPASGCTSCITGGATVQKPVYLPGDIILGGLFSVHNAGATPLTCGRINKDDGAELLEAFFYGLQNARSLNLWPGKVGLGGIAFDDCSSPQLASNTLINFLNGEDFGSNADAKRVYGYTAGNDDAITLAVASLLSPIPLPQIGYKPAPAILSDKSMFPNFAELLPGKADSIAAVTQLLNRLGVSHIRIVHDNSEESTDLLQGFQSIGMPDNVCVGGIGFSDPSNYQMAIDEVFSKPNAKVLYLNGPFSHFESFLAALNRSSNAAEYLVIPSPSLNAGTTFANRKYNFRTLTWMVKTPVIDGWQQYLRSLTPDKESMNPWLKEWYQAAYNCYLDVSNQQGYPDRCRNTANMPITSAPGYKESPYSAYVVMAVGALARSIDKTLQQYCGASYTTVCSGYVNAVDRAEKITKFLMEDPYLNGAVVNGYDVAYMRPGTTTFTMIGDVQYEKTSAGRNAKLTLNTGAPESIGALSSSCGSFCKDCLYMYEQQPSMYLPGDILIANLINVHFSGASPYTCGDYRTQDGFQYVEAFRYAINKVNDRTAPVNLRDVKLGGLALDSCSQDLMAVNLASSVYSGAITPRDEQGNPVDVSKIKGWLMTSSDTTKRVASVLGRLGVAALSDGASSVDLNNQELYPTLYRTVPDDAKQAHAMATIIDYLKWPYVQIVNEPTSYGRAGVQSVREALNKNSKCSIANYEWLTDGTADEIVAKLLASSTSVVVLFGGQNMTNQLLDAKMRAGRVADKLVFITSEKIQDMPSAVNTLAFGVDTPTVQEFNTYLATLVPGSEMTDPWFNEAYQAVYKCNLPGNSMYATACMDISNRPYTSSPGFQQDPRVLTTINAVYALVQAIDKALIERCGATYTTVCKEFMAADDAMQLIVNKLEEVSFRDSSGEEVRFNNRQHDRGYAVYKYGTGGDSIRIGEYKAGVLRVTDSSLQDSYKTVTSSCPGSCLQCQYQQQQTQEFTAMQGDVYFAGLFDVHEAGKSPFSCGDINIEQGWQLVEAFNFAIGRVNNKTGMFNNMLPGVKIGGIGLDTCSSPSRASNLVANIQSGLLPLMMDKTRINPERIDVYIGAYDSDTSAAVADFLNLLGIPQLSYGATSTAFKDTKKYPNFLRTVPADDKLARAVVALLKNYKIEYVQVVNSPGTYGDDAAAEFTKLAADNNICVAQVVRLSETNGRLTDALAEQATRELLNKPQAVVIVTFIATSDINSFLRAVNSVPEASRFHFVGSETWSSRVDLLKDVGQVAKDALTLGVETADLSTFDKYLRSKTRGSYMGNPWFDEYYESVFDCSLTPGSGNNPRECPTDRDVVLAPGYTQDQYVLYTVNAVYSAALGLDYALKQTCGQPYFGVCDEFRNAANRRQLILNGIKRATFQDATNQRFDFTSDGESNRGYHIYTARQTPGSNNYYYENVGSYNDTDLLKIRPQQEFALTWTSDCTAPGACEECTRLGHRPTRGMVRARPNLNLVGFFDVHYADPMEPLRCGMLNMDYGFQNTLAFFYAIDRFNRNNKVGVLLGGLAVDTCGSYVQVTRDLFSLLTGQGHLAMGLDPSSVVAVIPHGKGTSQTVAPLLAPRGVTMVSPTSGDDMLIGSPYFLSTIPPNAKRAEALSAVARAMGWKYMSAINSDSENGNSGMQSFFNSANSANNGQVICMAGRYTLKDGATLEDARAMIRQLARKEGSNTVVLFTSPEHTRLLLQATQAERLQDRFIFLGAEGSGSDAKVPAGLEDVANGAITLRVRSALIQDFMEYVMSLTVAQHGDIPDDWFAEFWQMALKCKLENSTRAQDQHARVCYPGDRLTPATFMQDDYVLQTIIATYVAAEGLVNADNCRTSSLGVAGCLREAGEERRQLIYEGIRGSSWQDDGQSDFTFGFNSAGYGNTGFDVFAQQKKSDSYEYEYKQIGTWSDNGLSINPNEYTRRRPSDPSQTPRSSCPVATTCNCLAFNGSIIGVGGSGTINPPTFEPVVGRREGSVDGKIGDTWAIVVMALTALGILVTLCAFVYLLVFYPIKGGTSVLGFILLFAVLAMYVLVFAFVLNSVPETCAIRRFCLGLVYALAFSCMLVKVLNTWRLGAYFTEYLPSYQRLAHPCSLVFIVLSLTMVQVIIGMEWLILKPPLVENLMIDTNTAIPRCAPANFHNEELVLSCIYVMALMLLTLIFSAVTWDSEENHRESRWMLITTCFSIGILIVWTVVSTLTEIKYREPCIAIALLINATIILLAIFVRKIYLLSKYQKEADEERKSQFAIHDDTKDHDFYSTLYNNQAFDHSGDTGSRKGAGSHTGSGVVYVYDGTTGQSGMGQNVY